MLIISNPTISPQVVEVNKEFVISIAVAEVATTWADLCEELATWQALVNSYSTWKQVKQR